MLTLFQLLDEIRFEVALCMFVVGCILGSFLNVAGIRLPVGQSVVYPSSGCPHCGHRLSAVDLIPVLGWLIRRGKCHYCDVPISPIYLFGELAAGIGFAAATYLIHDTAALLLTYPLIAVLIVLSVSDLKYRLLPDKIIFPVMLVYVILRLWIHDVPYWEYAAGFLFGGGMLFAVSYFSVRLGKPAMGGGDIKLMALLGFALGIKLIVITVLLSSTLGFMIGIILIASGRMGRRTFIPFGPFIAVGGIATLLIGNQLLEWYLTRISLI